jgi:hypothetical protein
VQACVQVPGSGWIRDSNGEGNLLSRPAAAVGAAAGGGAGRLAGPPVRLDGRRSRFHRKKCCLSKGLPSGASNSFWGARPIIICLWHCRARASAGPGTTGIWKPLSGGRQAKACRVDLEAALTFGLTSLYIVKSLTLECKEN